MSINDPTNLTHLSELVNQYTVNKNLDLDAIEKDMIHNTRSGKTSLVSPNDAFRSAIEELQKDVGITLDNNIYSEEPPPNFVKSSSRSNREKPSPQPAQNEFDEVQEQVVDFEANPTNEDEAVDFLTSIKNEYTPTGPTSSSSMNGLYNLNSQQERNSPPKRAPLRPRGPAPQPYQSYQPPQYAPPQQYQQQYQPPQQQYQPHPQPPQEDYGNNYYDPNRYDANSYYDPEQGDNRQSHLSNVISNYGGGQLDEQSLKREQEEDTKSILLEDIDEIKFELEDDNVDISRVPEVDQDSPLADVQKVHKMLRVKYIRRRYNDFGHEIILAGAQGLGYIFDGQRQVGPFKPNFNGWHNEVRTKLRRMRYETATIVSDIVQEYNIGPVSRLLFELVPSAIIYSNMKKNQHGQSNYSVDQVSHAISELRDTV
jgi:hypothetical protein